MKKTTKFFGKIKVFLGKWDFGTSALCKEAGADVRSNGPSTRGSRQNPKKQSFYL